MKKTCLSLIAFLAMLLAGRAACADIDAAGIMEKSAESIVAIYTVNGSQYEGQGSGIIVSENGLILTNFHVIEGASAISVKLKNGDIFDDVDIVDYNQRKDLAVIRIKAIKLKPAVLGDSSAVRVGEEVVAIGNPLGLEHTISRGIISQVRDSGDGYKVIQSDATITHGSSGGALFNKKGEVIGITSAIMGDAAGENLNFSLPINYAIPYISDSPGISVAEFLDETGGPVVEPATSSAGSDGGRSQNSFDRAAGSIFGFGDRFCGAIAVDMSNMMDFMGWRFMAWVAMLGEMTDQDMRDLKASGLSMEDLVNEAATIARQEVEKDMEWDQLGNGTCKTTEAQVFDCDDVYDLADYYGMMGEKIATYDTYKRVGDDEMGVTTCGAIIIRDNLGEDLAMGLVLTDDWKIISMWEPEE